MNGIYVLLPIMAMGIAVAAIVSSSILKIQRMRLEEARLRAGDSGEVDALARQLSDLQHDVIEMQERLDFAERILAQSREAPGLPAVPPPGQPR
jgi:Tfp pilus assembly protein PilO